MKVENQTIKSKKSEFFENFKKINNFLRSKKKKLKDKKFHLESIKTINSIYKDEKCNLFTHVQIETISKCNGRCSFCPVSAQIDPRNLEYMKEELFFKIVNELKQINFKGVLSFFGNNEALLDKRIIDWIEKARDMLPETVFGLYTNGTPLNLKKFLRLTNVLDELVINNYNDEAKLHSNLEEIKKHVDNSNSKYDNVILRYRLENQIMNTRSGNSPTALNIKINATCTYPFHQINILPNGNISLCCNDAYGDKIMGNINENTLINIWNNDEYKKLRNEIYSSRQNIDFCKSCDEMDNNDDYHYKNSLIEKKKNETKKIENDMS